VTSVRSDKPVTGLRVTVSTAVGVRALEGTATCYTLPLAAVPAPTSPS